MATQPEAEREAGKDQERRADERAACGDGQGAQARQALRKPLVEDEGDDGGSGG